MKLFINLKKISEATTEYIVDKNDTIEGLSLKWNTAPSEILRTNHLSSRMLFPGQILHILNKNDTYSTNTTSKKLETKFGKDVEAPETLEKISQAKIKSVGKKLKKEEKKRVTSEVKNADDEYVKKMLLKLDLQLIRQDKSHSIIDGTLIMYDKNFYFNNKNN